MLNQKANPISKAGIALVLVLIVVYHLSVSAYAELRPGPREGFYEDDGIVYLYEGGVRSAKSGEYKAEGGTFTLDEGKVTAALLNVPKVNQLPKYPTGCEGASAAAVLQFYGLDVTLDEMIDAIPRENIEFRDGKRYGPSIEEKFVGDPRGGYTSNNPGYGAFSPVVAKAMNNVLAKHESSKVALNITGATVADLFGNLRNGNPMVIWATYNMTTPEYKNSWYINETGEYFSYPRMTRRTSTSWTRTAAATRPLPAPPSRASSNSSATRPSWSADQQRISNRKQRTATRKTGSGSLYLVKDRGSLY